MMSTRLIDARAQCPLERKHALLARFIRVGKNKPLPNVVATTHARYVFGYITHVSTCYLLRRIHAGKFVSFRKSLRLYRGETNETNVNSQLWRERGEKGIFRLLIHRCRWQNIVSLTPIMNYHIGAASLISVKRKLKTGEDYRGGKISIKIWRVTLFASNCRGRNALL